MSDEKSNKDEVTVSKTEESQQHLTQWLTEKLKAYWLVQGSEMRLIQELSAKLGVGPFANSSSDEPDGDVTKVACAERPYELVPMGFVIEGPKGSRFVRKQARIEHSIQQLSAKTGDDPADYTATEVFAKGYSLDAILHPETPRWSYTELDSMYSRLYEHWQKLENYIIGRNWLSEQDIVDDEPAQSLINALSRLNIATWVSVKERKPADGVSVLTYPGWGSHEAQMDEWRQAGGCFLMWTEDVGGPEYWLEVPPVPALTTQSKKD